MPPSKVKASETKQAIVENRLPEGKEKQKEFHIRKKLEEIATEKQRCKNENKNYDEEDMIPSIMRLNPLTYMQKKHKYGLIYFYCSETDLRLGKRR
jgi:hypothetical protein